MVELKKAGFQPLNLEQAFAMQYRLIDVMRQHLDGYAQLEAGDYGVHPQGNRPRRTAAVEAILADFFEAQAAALVRGAGTGAIRYALHALVAPGARVLVHALPIYPTTKHSIHSMGLQPVMANLNDPAQIAEVIRQGDVSAVLIQHTYQADDDEYRIEDVVRTIRQAAPQIPIISDDNYAAMKVARIGVQQGTNLSAFSSFKLLGPAGVGIVVGDGDAIQKIRSLNYSGGSQIQGPEAMDVLRALIDAPVNHAAAVKVISDVLERAPHVVPDVKMSVSWIQGIHMVVRFSEPIADSVGEAAAKLGALPYPVGAESRYEIAPLFYRMSGTFREREPELARYMMRIVPMRSGPDTILSILREAIAIVQKNREIG